MFLLGLSSILAGIAEVILLNIAGLTIFNQNRSGFDISLMYGFGYICELSVGFFLVSRLTSVNERMRYYFLGNLLQTLLTLLVVASIYTNNNVLIGFVSQCMDGTNLLRNIALGAILPDIFRGPALVRSLTLVTVSRTGATIIGPAFIAAYNSDNFLGKNLPECACFIQIIATLSVLIWWKRYGKFQVVKEALPVKTPAAISFIDALKIIKNSKDLFVFVVFQITCYIAIGSITLMKIPLVDSLVGSDPKNLAAMRFVSAISTLLGGGLIFAFPKFVSVNSCKAGLVLSSASAIMLSQVPSNLVLVGICFFIQAFGFLLVGRYMSIWIQSLLTSDNRGAVYAAFDSCSRVVHGITTVFSGWLFDWAGGRTTVFIWGLFLFVSTYWFIKIPNTFTEDLEPKTI